MPENVDNLILEQLRGVRNDVGSMRAEMHDSLKEVKARLTTLEGLVAGGRRVTMRSSKRTSIDNSP